jgi:hypothetical protein
LSFDGMLHDERCAPELVAPFRISLRTHQIRNDVRVQNDRDSNDAGSPTITGGAVSDRPLPRRRRPKRTPSGPDKAAPSRSGARRRCFCR